MKYAKAIPIVLSLVSSTLAQSFCTSASHSGQSVKETSNKVGTIGSVGYEIWSDSGNNSATFYSDGSFSCSFSNAKDYLCRSGLSFDSTQTHSQIGHMYADFKLVKENISNVDYSYVGIYGWTRSPLVEYYIVDNWLSSFPPGDWVGNQKHGDFQIDGATYTVYENTRTGPSIDGDTTFKQYFSIRKSARDCGTIDISAHFEQWEKLGMTMGKMHEAKVLGEAGSTGSGTSGTADFPYAKVYIGSGNGGGGGAAATAPAQEPAGSAGGPVDSNPIGSAGTKTLPNNNNNNIQSTKTLPNNSGGESSPSTKTIGSNFDFGGNNNGGWNNNNNNNGGWNNNNNNNGGWNTNNNNNNGGWDWATANNNNGGWNNDWNNNNGWNNNNNGWNNNNNGWNGNVNWATNNNGGWNNNNNNNGGWDWNNNNNGNNYVAFSNAVADNGATKNNNGGNGGNRGNCAALWGQCGGQGYNGATCCTEGACVAINDYFHQCQN